MLLSIEDYQRLLNAFEDRLDASDLEEAISANDGFVPFEQVREDLRREGKL